ncbi:MAG: SurA N-terminal domain-containing protein [Porticoccaceae bacterium]|nr:SurA N-terminal domain-containing protein [Porticoccaceae bacterium]
MLDNFRNNMRGIATVIVVLIGGIFAFSGTGSLFLSGAAVETELVVNDEQVSALRIQQAIGVEKRRILSENDGLDPALVDDELIRPSVVQQMIGRKVIAQSAREQGMGISTKTVSELLIETPSFQTDGRFDQDVYQYAIRQQGYTSATFIEMVKEDLLIQQVVQGMIATNFVTQAELGALAGLTEQTRDYYYLTLPIAPIMSAVQLGEDQIEGYYQQNKSQYQTDDQVVIDYIELNAGLLTAGKSATPEQIKARFEQEAESVDTSVSRQAAHILLTDPSVEVVADIQTKLDAGEDFSALAKKYSEDVGSADTGGDLGYSSGDTFPESFETALAALEVGQVSSAVQTDSGTHFIKLLNTQVQSFDLAEESARIEQELLAEQVDNAMVEKLEMLKELSFNAETLAVVAADLDLTAQVSSPFSRAGGDGVAAYPAVIKAAFSSEVLDDNYASEVLDLGDDRYIVIKLNESISARQKELPEVRTEVENALRAVTAQQIIAQQGGDLLASVEGGETVEAVAKANDLDWQVALGVKRNDRTVNPEVLNLAFQLQMPAEKAVVEGFYARNGDYVVAALQQVIEGDVARLSKAEKASLMYATDSINGSRLVQAYQASLVAGAEIKQ